MHALGEDSAIPHDTASQIFIDTMNTDKCARLVIQQGSQIRISKLLKQTSEQEQISLSLEEERTVELSEGERIVAHTNGMLIVEGASGKSRSIFVHQNLEKRALSGSTSTHNHNPSDESSMTSASAAPEQRIKESQVLEMSIDAGQVTADSLEKYENLMKGKVALAKSNANYQSGSKSALQSDLCSIHTWRNDERRHEREVGAFEMKFEKPTSLVSLNIDLTFECQDTRKLLHSLSPEVQSAVNDQE